MINIKNDKTAYTKPLLQITRFDNASDNMAFVSSNIGQGLKDITADIGDSKINSLPTKLKK